MIALFFSWILSACASTLVPQGPAVVAPQFTSATFTTADDVQLPLREWLPNGSPKAIVIALHGFNDYSKSFGKVPDAVGLGQFLSERGIAVFAYDQRGFGQGPHHGLWPGTATLVGDFTAFTRLIHKQYPGVPVYGLGESMGGAVLMAALASADPPQLDGAILSSPAVWARKTMPLVYRVALWVADKFAPAWRPTGQSLGRQASDNIEMLRDNGRDPYFIKKTRIDAVDGLVGLMDRAYISAANLRVPTLYLYGRNDEIIPAPPSAGAMKQLLSANPRARAAFYDLGWHMMLRDKNGPVVMGDIASFIASPTAPLPSGADHDALARLEAALKKKKAP